MNPYLLQIAKDHQAEIRRAVETEQQLEEANLPETSEIHGRKHPASRVFRTVNFLAGFFGNNKRTAG